MTGPNADYRKREHPADGNTQSEPTPRLLACQPMRSAAIVTTLEGLKQRSQFVTVDDSIPANMQSQPMPHVSSMAVQGDTSEADSPVEICCMKFFQHLLVQRLDPGVIPCLL